MVHDWTVVPEYALHGLGLEPAQVGVGPHEMPPLLLPLPLPAPLLLLLPLLPPQSAASMSGTQIGCPTG